MMRWIGGRESDNIEDRRGIPMGRGVVGGGLGTLAVILIAMFFGVDPSTLLDTGDSGAPTEQSALVQESPADANLRKFVSVVLAETEDTWSASFAKMGRTYQKPVLVLFTGGVQSACGFAQTASGPFYCPADSKVYLDLDFLRELSTRFGAPGDFARAYVIAHEVGHHVQNLLGLMGRDGSALSQGANGQSVRTELQADCLAGAWARNTDLEQHILEQGDIESAMAAAAAVGDDRLQRQARGTVVPDSFTHGTSTQRVRWFKRGFEGGTVESCDTFSAERL
jgi:predicted metalloprotease